jgi:hypothetical protein
VNWKVGDDVIVHPSVSNEEAKTLFPNFTVHKLPSEAVRGLKHFESYKLTSCIAIPPDDPSQG